MKAVIHIHSFVDLITNSSTELFIVDKEKGLDMVRAIVNEALITYPPQYDDHNLSIRIDDRLAYTGEYYNDEEVIKYLEAKGYTVVPPAEEKQPEAIIVSWERGCMSPGFIHIISDIFGVEVEDY